MKLKDKLTDLVIGGVFLGNETYQEIKHVWYHIAMNDHEKVLADEESSFYYYRKL